MLVILDAQQPPWDERQAARGRNVVQLRKMTTVQEELRVDEGASRSRSQLFAGAARPSFIRVDGDQGQQTGMHAFGTIRETFGGYGEQAERRQKVGSETFFPAFWRGV